MKTKKDLEEYKKTPNNIFGTTYEFLIRDLENDYISKLNGQERITQKLSDWDGESTKIILLEVIRRLKNSGCMDIEFDFFNRLIKTSENKVKND